jgi:hypothetical protein
VNDRYSATDFGEGYLSVLDKKTGTWVPWGRVTSLRIVVDNRSTAPHVEVIGADMLDVDYENGIVTVGQSSPVECTVDLVAAPVGHVLIHHKRERKHAQWKKELKGRRP